MEKYDLIILQYGLNVMETRVTDYRYYGEQLQRIIAYLRSSFPTAAILVMGVSDRCSVVNGVPVSMSVADIFEAAQRDAARASGVAFWSTRRAMQSKGGMAHFVEQRWAARDYTHIGYNGGRQIAKIFTDYIAAAVESIKNAVIENFVTVTADEYNLIQGLYPLPRLLPLPVSIMDINQPTVYKIETGKSVEVSKPEHKTPVHIEHNRPVSHTDTTSTDTDDTIPVTKPIVSIVPIIDDSGKIVRIDTIK
jgi:hypothetical protein